MKWSFGIITDGQQDERLLRVVNSIGKLNIPDDDFEIIIVGNTKVCGEKIRVIPFDETVKKMWITRKKNIIAQEAKFENLCLLHDYWEFDRNWYQSFERFDRDWDVCICRVLNLDGSRIHCWVHTDPWRKTHVIDFGDTSHTKTTMYVSGGFYCVKKAFALQHPLDERLVWGQEEDVEWSKRVRPFWRYKINAETYVQAMKQKFA